MAGLFGFPEGYNFLDFSQGGLTGVAPDVVTVNPEPPAIPKRSRLTLWIILAIAGVFIFRKEIRGALR